MTNNVLKKKFLRCQSAFGRFTCPNLTQSRLEPTISVTTQQSPHVVTTTGVTNSHDGVIPIASLFSSSDLGPSSTSSSSNLSNKKRPSTPGALMRRSASFQQYDQDKEQTAMYVN